MIDSKGIDFRNMLIFILLDFNDGDVACQGVLEMDNGKPSIPQIY
jgi:hypothetical protein